MKSRKISNVLRFIKDVIQRDFLHKKQIQQFTTLSSQFTTIRFLKAYPYSTFDPSTPKNQIQ